MTQGNFFIQVNSSCVNISQVYEAEVLHSSKPVLLLEEQLKTETILINTYMYDEQSITCNFYIFGRGGKVLLVKSCVLQVVRVY